MITKLHHLGGPRLACAALLFLAAGLAACGQSAGHPGDEIDAGPITIDAPLPPPPDASCEATHSCPPPDCARLRQAGQCPDHRVCMDSATGGACLEQCEPDYQFNAATGECDSCSVVQCGPPPTCVPGVPGSIADQCAAQHRECSEDDRACGACVAGYKFDATTAACVRDCGTTACDAGTHVERQGDACACVANVCPDGEAVVQGANPFQCTGTGGVPSCNLHCSAQGENGVYQVTTKAGTCVCGTDAGYYWSSTQHAARRCDADGDGWINRSAWDAYNSDDPTIAAIARAGCDLARVDRIVLANEYEQEKTLYVCAGGFSDEPCAQGEASTLPLVEPDANDSQAIVDATPAVTPAPGGGRRLLARELNAVTKACVSAAADFDGDGHADVAESQVIRPSTDPADRWSQIAYFVELHTGEYEAATDPSAPGRFVISERSRCDSHFPMGYADGAGTWWRECTRQRDARWIDQVDVPGFDFAQWTDRGDPIAAFPPIASTPPAGASPAAHGLCSLAPPWTGAWRGMTHHSQFKCVLLDDSAQRPSWGYPTTSFTSTGYLDFQQCTAKPASFGAPPSFACAVQGNPAAPSVGWAAVRYQDAPLTPGGPALHDVAGCVDETIWRTSSPSICPASTPKDADGNYAETSDPSNFGNLICACDPRDPTRHPGMADPIDDNFFDSNCDGIDGDADKMVFVAIDGQDASTCGTRANPCRTINYGIGLATAGRPDVAVSEGTYDERVVMHEGISIHGGYSRDHGWTRDPGYVAKIASTAIQWGATPYSESVYAESLQSATIDRFTIATPGRPDVVGSSVYGVRMVSSHLVLEHVTVAAGTAGNGGGGDGGWNGGGGANGGDGSGQTHGGGGANVCGGDHGGGGNGGNGGWDGIGGACGTGGDGPGQPGGGWCGGGGGGGSPRCGSGGQPGYTGNDGTCEGGWTGGTSQQSSFGGLGWNVWIPYTGGDGGTGGPGDGGTGGGGGGAGDAVAFGTGGTGGGGGGGGSGGCGGGGGHGGHGGGASIAMLAISSSPSLVDATFTAGAGGRGGGGGGGGWGGPGGAGGQGGKASGGSGLGVSGAGDGGRGGNGGSGGRGGGGQGGPGGPSVGVMLCNSSADGVVNAAGGPGGGAGAGGAPNGPPGPTAASLAVKNGCSM